MCQISYQLLKENKKNKTTSDHDRTTHGSNDCAQLVFDIKNVGKNNESNNKQFISHVNYRDLFHQEISKLRLSI